MGTFKKNQHFEKLVLGISFFVNLNFFFLGIEISFSFPEFSKVSQVRSLRIETSFFNLIIALIFEPFLNFKSGILTFNFS